MIRLALILATLPLFAATCPRPSPPKKDTHNPISQPSRVVQPNVQTGHIGNSSIQAHG